MTSSNDPVEPRGDDPPPTPGARVVGPVDRGEPMTVTVTLCPRVPEPSDAEIERMALLPIRERDEPSREEYAAAHGADPEDLKKVEDYAHACGLKVVESSAAKRQVVLAGKAEDCAAAFGVKLDRYEHPGGTFRASSSPVQLPAHLAPLVESVLGLDDRPIARPRPS